MNKLAEEEKQMVEMALGRIFGMMQRAEQPGDVAEYLRCRSIILDLAGNGCLSPYQLEPAAAVLSRSQYLDQR